MKRYLLITIITSFSIALFATTNKDCKGGFQGKGSSENPSPTLGDAALSAFADMVWAIDPNELVGPVGYDTLRWVSINDVLHYTIYFENSEELASANAQIVDVRFRFPYPEMMNSFELGEYNFALQNFPVKTQSNTFKSRMDLRDNMFIYVDLAAGLDIPNQQAYWHFSSIDPQTGFAPWQYNRGLLPVNDSTHAGEGYVTFSMKPAPSLQTGDTIGFFASILFDQNDTIPTNRWRNYVDAGAPQSAIINTPDEETPLLYHLSFTASDDEGGCGIKRIILYLKDNMGIWQEIASASPDTVIDMQLELGDSYKLISIAEDHVGNREPFKEVPDLILNANLAPTDILLSDSTFRDDSPDNGYIGTLSTIDTESGAFIYALAEGEGAIHNDLFLIQEDQLLLRQSLRCAYDTIYHIRISTTDAGGMTFSKQFRIYMSHVLSRPDNDTITVRICEGDSYIFRGQEYDQPGLYIQSVAVLENVCDSTFVVDVTVLPLPIRPVVSILNGTTLVSSADEGNKWMRCETTGDILVSTDKQFVPKGDGNYYLIIDNGACASESSDTIVVQSEQNEVSFTLSLAKGWSWFSSILDDAPNKHVPTFLQPIRNAVDSLSGNTRVITELTPAESYKIHTKQTVQYTWHGVACNPANYPLSLAYGWNRIGYPLAYTANLTNAWSAFLPEEGDIIKTYEAFSTFHGGQWIGSLQTLSPGDGLMYYSQSPKNMLFSTDSVHVVVRPSHAPRANEEVPQNTAIHQYPDNTTLIAMLKGNEDVEIPEGVYTAMAYSGNAVIGIGSYIEGLIYMVMYGDDELAAPIRFRAYNHLTGEVEEISEQISYTPEPLGSYVSPYILHLTYGQAITYAYSDEYAVYPNPVRDRLYVQGDIAEINELSIYSLAGVRVGRFETITEAGVVVEDIADGTYLVIISTTSGSKHIRKMIKQSISANH